MSADRATAWTWARPWPLRKAHLYRLDADDFRPGVEIIIFLPACSALCGRSREDSDAALAVSYPDSRKCAKCRARSRRLGAG